MAASRSFKPSSYLATTTMPARRPSFARTSSSSSTKSAMSSESEDSFVASIRNTSIQATTGGTTSSVNFNNGSGESNTQRSSIGSGAVLEVRTAGPKVQVPHIPLVAADASRIIHRSKPIAIELPPANAAARRRSAPVYTPEEPLSARGDLQGGYFPFHEEVRRSYKPHPFQYEPRNATNHISAMSSMSSSPLSGPSSSNTTPKAPTHMVSTNMQASIPISDALAIPKGKYHPSKYKIAPPSMQTPALSIPSPAQFITPTPQPASPKSHRNRRSTDLKRKLQQYQRDMIAQARLASISSASQGGTTKPISPQLLPLGSPGDIVITPLELEENAGYLGARRLVSPGETFLGGGDRGEMVGRMIRAEEERRRREGQSSPLARV